MHLENIGEARILETFDRSARERLSDEQFGDSSSASASFTPSRPAGTSMVERMTADPHANDPHSEPHRADPAPQTASPACLLSEVDPNYAGLATSPGEERANILRWRKAERARLIAERVAMPVAERSERAVQIAAALDERLPDLDGVTVSLYWPLRGEPDLRAWLASISRRGAICALPLVIEKGAPLVFRTWRPGEPMVRGFWNIPVPEGGDEVRPDILLAPFVGFDRENFRLGYGGGYFDRTLATFARKPRVIGVGFARFAIPTIYPLDHDIAMSEIVTDESR
jgi:5-formyltetrahydrofolate cyclo-ligase